MILSGPFVVKIAGRVQEVMPGATYFGHVLVLERLPATISSRGKIKALWRSQCELCHREIIKDLAKGPPICRCANRTPQIKGDQKYKRQVLGIIANSRTFIPFRKIMVKASRLGVKDEPTLRSILQELLTAGRIKQARSEQARGYALVRNRTQTKQGDDHVIDHSGQ